MRPPRLNRPTIQEWRLLGLNPKMELACAELKRNGIGGRRRSYIPSPGSERSVPFRRRSGQVFDSQASLRATGLLRKPGEKQKNARLLQRAGAQRSTDLGKVIVRPRSNTERGQCRGRLRSNGSVLARLGCRTVASFPVRLVRFMRALLAARPAQLLVPTTETFPGKIAEERGQLQAKEADSMNPVNSMALALCTDHAH